MLLAQILLAAEHSCAAPAATLGVFGEPARLKPLTEIARHPSQTPTRGVQTDVREKTFNAETSETLGIFGALGELGGSSGFVARLVDRSAFSEFLSR